MDYKSVLGILFILLLVVGGYMYIDNPSIDADNLYVEKHVETTKYTSGKVEKDYFIDYSYDVLSSHDLDEISVWVNLYDKNGKVIKYEKFTDGLSGGYYTLIVEKSVYKKIASVDIFLYDDETDECFDIINTAKIHKGENIVDKIDDIVHETPKTTSTSSSSSSSSYDSYSSDYNSYSDTSGYGDYIGNSNTHKFHSSYCSWADNIKPGNRISFSSREEALGSGYSPCGHCNP